MAELKYKVKKGARWWEFIKYYEECGLSDIYEFSSEETDDPEYPLLYTVTFDEEKAQQAYQNQKKELTDIIKNSSNRFWHQLLNYYFNSYYDKTVETSYDAWHKVIGEIDLKDFSFVDKLREHRFDQYVKYGRKLDNDTYNLAIGKEYLKKLDMNSINKLIDYDNPEYLNNVIGQVKQKFYQMCGEDLVYNDSSEDLAFIKFLTHNAEQSLQNGDIVKVSGDSTILDDYANCSYLPEVLNKEMILEHVPEWVCNNIAYAYNEKNRSVEREYCDSDIDHGYYYFKHDDDYMRFRKKYIQGNEKYDNFANIRKNDFEYIYSASQVAEGIIKSLKLSEKLTNEIEEELKSIENIDEVFPVKHKTGGLTIRSLANLPKYRSIFRLTERMFIAYFNIAFRSYTGIAYNEFAGHFIEKLMEKYVNKKNIDFVVKKPIFVEDVDNQYEKYTLDEFVKVLNGESIVPKEIGEDTSIDDVSLLHKKGSIKTDSANRNPYFDATFNLDNAHILRPIEFAADWYVKHITKSTDQKDNLDKYQELYKQMIEKQLIQEAMDFQDQDCNCGYAMLDLRNKDCFGKYTFLSVASESVILYTYPNLKAFYRDAISRDENSYEVIFSDDTSDNLYIKKEKTERERHF